MVGAIASFILGINPLLAVVLIAFAITLFITLAYKYMTNQRLMKELKEEMKGHQKEIKEHRKDPKKMMDIQKKMMDKNMQYMLQSFKPMILTLLPVFILFWWLNASFAYEPIAPGEQFTTTAKFANGFDGKIATLIVPEGLELTGATAQEIKDRQAEWSLKGKEGEYVLEYQFDDRSLTRDVLITREREYKAPLYNTKDKDLKTITINNKPRKILNIFGWKIGWLGTYIIFSLVFSLGLRKVLKVY